MGLDPLTLTVLGVAGWTVRFAADQGLQRSGSAATDVAVSRFQRLVRSARAVPPEGSPVESASIASFRDASWYLQKCLADELGVGLIRRGRPEAQWCSAYRKLLKDNTAVAGFRAVVDVGSAPGIAADELIGSSFHQSYLDWLRARDLGKEPTLVEQWVLGGIPDPSAPGARKLLYDLYLGYFNARYRKNAQLKAALDAIRFEAIPAETVDELEARKTEWSDRGLVDARGAHLQRTIALNGHLWLPLCDREERRVKVAISDLYVDLPLEPPPGAGGPGADSAGPPTASHADRVRQPDPVPGAGSATSYENAAAPEPPSLSVGTCLADRPRLLITGGPGSGKSSILRFLAWHYAHVAVGEDPLAASEHASDLTDKLPQRSRLPVLIRCKYLSGAELRAPLRELIAAQLRKDNGVKYDLVDPFSEELLELAREGSALILVDGLDEVHDDVRPRLAEMLEQESDAHPELPVVISSRHTGLAAVAPMLRACFDHYEIAALAAFHQARFISRCGAVAPRLGAEQGQADRLGELVAQSRELSRLGEFIQPLTLIAQIYLRDGQIPEKRAKLYRQAVRDLIRSREGNLHVKQAAGDLIRSREGDLQVNDVWPEMTHLAYRMHKSNVVVWGLPDAEAAVDQFLRRARDRGLEQVLGRPLPTSASQWLQMAVRLAILNQSGSVWGEEELNANYGEEVAARVEFCHLAFQEFCAAHAVVSPHRVVARG